jgi:hypothetical protein
MSSAGPTFGASPTHNIVHHATTAAVGWKTRQKLAR